MKKFTAEAIKENMYEKINTVTVEDCGNKIHVILGDWESCKTFSANRLADAIIFANELLNAA